MDTKYYLILWPKSQEYMEEDWFKDEAYLCTPHRDQPYEASAYFIPTYRVIEHLDFKTNQIEGDSTLGDDAADQEDDVCEGEYMDKRNKE